MPLDLLQTEALVVHHKIHQEVNAQVLQEPQSVAQVKVQVLLQEVQAKAALVLQKEDHLQVDHVEDKKFRFLVG